MQRSRYAFVAFFLYAYSLGAQSLSAQNLGPSGLPLPRMVSLKFEEVRMRTGPGQDFPVRWVYEQLGWPVMVKAEFENWRQISDADGKEGWVHSRLLSSSRSAVVTAEMATVRVSEARDAAPIAQLGRRVVTLLHRCNQHHCEVSVDNYRGWIGRDQIWGWLDGEVFD